jgi:AcrR family transcriptional regulator
MISGLRERKKQATRQAISDIATGMFERDGFDAVSIAQVAAEANVAKMTVTNYFARKEDLVFDRADFVIGELAQTVAERAAGQSPLDAARAGFLAAVQARSPLVGFARASFARMIDDSPVLTARYREMMDLRDRRLADQLREEFGLSDPIAQFHAAQLGSVLRIVTGEARRLLIEGMSLDDLQVFLEDTGGRMFDLLDGALADLIPPRELPRYIWLILM